MPGGFLYRDNRVPYYQRLYQKNDGVRLWNKAPRSKYMLYPFYFVFWSGLSSSMYMMVRLLLVWLLPNFVAFAAQKASSSGQEAHGDV